MTYRKFTFPVEPSKPIKLPPCKNGLFNVLFSGYSNHIPIKIRPDDILNNVVAVWSKYLVCHAEEFRSQFVTHEGQKELTYHSGGTYHDNRMPEFMNGLLKLVKKDQESDKLEWTEAEFSTTEFSDRMIRSAATLASQKKFYKYGVTLMCGFSEVELLGTEEDWLLLTHKIQNMPILDQSVADWQWCLISTIYQMIEGKEDFWQACVVERQYGSGSQEEYTGWIGVFNPINEKGKWLIKTNNDGSKFMSIIKNNDLLDLTSEFKVHINDNGVEFDVEVRSGPVHYNNEDQLSVSNFFNIGKLAAVNQEAVK